MKDRIFIGRKRELDNFKNWVGELNSDIKGGGILKKLRNPKQGPPSDYPRVILCFGEGGLGKSTLIQEFRAISETIEKGRKGKVNQVFIDWHDLYHVHGIIPNEPSIFLSVILNSISNQSPALASKFTKVKEVLSWLEKATGKLKEKLSKLDATEDFAKEAINSIVGISAPPVLSSLFSLLGSWGVGLGMKKLKKLNIYTDKELDSLKQYRQNLAYAFLEDLENVSKKTPLLFLIDTYELADEPDLDAWFRKAILSKIAEKKLAVSFVISGRQDHLRDYRNDIEEPFLKVIDFNHLAFTKNEIVEFSKILELKLSEEELVKISEATTGIPLLVRDVLIQLQAGKSLNEMVSFESGISGDLLEKYVKRLLLHSISDHDKEGGGDLKMIFALTMIPFHDEMALRFLWDVNGEGLSTIFRRLEARHSFISKGAVHEGIRKFILKFLILQFSSNDTNTWTPLIAEIGSKLSGYYREIFRITELYSNDDARLLKDMSDKNTLINYVMALGWSGGDHLYIGVLNFVPFLLKNHFFPNNQFVTTVIRFLTAQNFKLSELVKILPSPNLNQMDQILLDPKWKNDLSYFVWANRHNLQPVPFAITCFQVAQIEIRSKKYDAAYFLLTNDFNKFSFDERLKPEYAELCYLIAEKYYDEGKLTKSHSIINSVLAVDPRNSKAINLSGIIEGKQTSNSEAIERFKKAVNIDETSALAWFNLGRAYKIEKDMIQAKKCFLRAIELDPSSPAPQCCLGDLLRITKYLENGKRHLERAHELNPHFRCPEAYFPSVGNPHIGEEGIQPLFDISLQDKYCKFHTELPRKWVPKATNPNCFVATVAFGDSNIWQLDALRDFRDRVLMPNPFGKSLVKLYYKNGSAWASKIRGKNGAKWALRFLVLSPLVQVLRLLGFRKRTP